MIEEKEEIKAVLERALIQCPERDIDTLEALLARILSEKEVAA